MSRAEQGLTNAELVDLLAQALGELSSAARPTVSQLMLDAVLERALINAGDAYPSLPRARIEAGRADFAALRAAAPGLKRGALTQAIEFTLTDFLAILGNLTAELLSEGLQSRLDAVSLMRKRGGPKGRETR